VGASRDTFSAAREPSARAHSARISTLQHTLVFENEPKRASRFHKHIVSHLHCLEFARCGCILFVSHLICASWRRKYKSDTSRSRHFTPSPESGRGVRRCKQSLLYHQPAGLVVWLFAPATPDDIQCPCGHTNNACHVTPRYCGRAVCSCSVVPGPPTRKRHTMQALPDRYRQSGKGCLQPRGTTRKILLRTSIFPKKIK